mgnify:CR=1 FL=1
MKSYFLIFQPNPLRICPISCAKVGYQIQERISQKKLKGEKTKNVQSYTISFSEKGELNIRDNTKLVFSGNVFLVTSDKVINKDICFILKEKSKYILKFDKTEMGYIIIVNKNRNVIDIRYVPSSGYEGYTLLLQGIFHIGDGIPCFLNPNESNESVFFMTSGRPTSTCFDALYFLKDDLAVQFLSSNRLLCPSERNVKVTLHDNRKITVQFLDNYYKKDVNQLYKPIDKKGFPHAPVGWLSYYCYFESPNEKEMLKNLNFAKEHLKRYGLEYFLIEAWQQNAWNLPVKNFYHSLEVDEKKFPHGMKYMADEIHKKGLKAGIWISPLGTGEKEFFEKNKEMYIISKEGKPLDNWCGWYVLDPTHPKAKKYIFETLKTVAEEWGYDYFKIDGLELGGNYSDRFLNRRDIKELLSNKKVDPLRTVVHLMREAIGEKRFFLAGGGDIKGKCVGIVNAARIGTDVFYSGQDPQWKSVVHMAKVTTVAYYVHNIFWYNDPDILSLRPPLTKKHAIMMATIIGITGQSLFSSDILYKLPKDRIYMLQRLMPIPDIYPGQLYKVTGLKNIWNLRIKRTFEEWNVVALFNWNEKEDITLILDVTSIGLEESKSYLLYDFWKDKFLGKLKGKREFNIKNQSCILLGIREEKPYPQTISVNRHITQGGVSLQRVNWSTEKNSLSGLSDIPGRDKYTLTIHLPEGYEVKSVITDKENIEYRKLSQQIVRVIIECPENSMVNWAINFS